MMSSYHFGLVGRNIGYSLSPMLHQANIDALGLNATYELVDVDHLDELISTWNEFQGLNVTIPYKEDIISYCDEVDEAVKKIGACNTIVFKKGKKIAYNTDWIGFIKQLESLDINFSGFLNTLIIGAGGAAKAVYYALKTKTNFTVTIANRTIEKAREMTTHTMTLEEASRELSNFDLIINATNVGVKSYDSPIKIEHVKPKSIFIDLNYQKKLKFVDDSHRLGAISVNGLTMLVEQAAESFRLWTNQVADIKRMYDIIE